VPVYRAALAVSLLFAGIPVVKISALGRTRLGVTASLPVSKKQSLSLAIAMVRTSGTAETSRTFRLVGNTLGSEDRIGQGPRSCGNQRFPKVQFRPALVP